MANVTLTAPVGIGGTNRKPDVLAVQQLLNRCLNFLTPLAPLDEDGIYGSKTSGMISEFQRRVVKMTVPDGRVDPAGKTLAALNNTATTGQLVPGPFNPWADTGGRQLVWGQKVSPAFREKVIAICGRLALDPDFLMAAMAFESGGSFSPSIRNAVGSGATGLIQFMPSTASGLGTSTTALAAMTAVEQLDYVEKYFTPFRNRLRVLEDVYMAILWPAAVGRPNEYVLFQSPSKAYDQNKGLDANKDGKVTKFEAAAAVRGMLNKGRAFVA